jgi:Flp pilus assembly pilin Flp
MTKKVNLNRNNEKGLSLLEYAIGAAVLSGIVLVAMNAFGTGVTTYFSRLSSYIQNLTIGS